MTKLYFHTIILATSILALSGCCSWDYSDKDFEFSKEELNLLGNYKIGDTIYFESNLGDIDTITIVEFFEDRHEGSRCFIQTEPYHSIDIKIKHLPYDKWAGTSQSEGKEKKIAYETLIGISKSPIDSIGKLAGYGINFKNFTTLGNALENTTSEYVINGRTISDCYKVTNGYPERVVNPDDIEIVYWTEKYGLTGYKNKSGETWLLKNL